MFIGLLNVKYIENTSLVVCLFTTDGLIVTA